FPVTGYNFRLTNLACALLCAQLERADEIVERRREIFAKYRARLDGLAGIEFQPIAPWAEPAPWLFCITVDERRYGRSRDDLTAILGGAHVDTRPFFLALHRLPPFRNESRGRGELLPVTERLSGVGLNLPTYAALTDGDVDRICQLIWENAR